MMQFHGIINPEDAVKAAQRRVVEQLQNDGISWDFIINVFEYAPPILALKTRAIHPEFEEVYHNLTGRQRGLCFIVLAADDFLYKDRTQVIKERILADISEQWQRWIVEPMVASNAIRHRQSKAAKNKRINPLTQEIIDIIFQRPAMTWRDVLRELENRKGLGIIEDVTNDSIEWWNKDQLNSTPITGLPDRLTTARKHI